MLEMAVVAGKQLILNEYLLCKFTRNSFLSSLQLMHINVKP